MATVARATPDVWHRRKEHLLEEVRHVTGVTFSLAARRGSRLARGPAGTLYLPAAREAQPGRWWLGLNEQAFTGDDEARGVVLLCDAGADVIDFWFSAAEIRDLLPRLSVTNGERKFNVVRRRERFFLQIPGGEEIDITGKRRNLAWVTSSPPASPLPDPAEVLPPWHPPFLARVRKGRLEALDPIRLEEGAVVLVRVVPAPAVPRQAALRRIVAAAGAESLPADFSEQHDHYAHGAPRR
ncbi:MAG: hypothetical protein FJ027_03840 [Candidatus Rokubacteria bacterium]|nr:hypothetical protein [Candidatus Rokubacteria bacterium]